MAFVDELKAVFHVVGRTIKELVMGESNPLNRYMKQLTMVIAVLLVAAGGYVGYRWHIAAREQKAYHTFAEYLGDFQSALKVDTSAEWNRVISLLNNGYAQHKASNVAPLLLSLKADAQIKLGELVAAGATLKQAIDALSKDSQLTPLLSVKYALLQLDAVDSELQKVGLQELIALARDKDNLYKDMALFYLGRYYWAHDQVEEAQKSWQELQESSLTERAYPSPWIREAEQKLTQIEA